MWYVLRAPTDSALLDPEVQAIIRQRDGSRIVKLHDHDDGTACVLMSGPAAQFIRKELGKAKIRVATPDDLRTAGIKKEDW